MNKTRYFFALLFALVLCMGTLSAAADCTVTTISGKMSIVVDGDCEYTLENVDISGRAHAALYISGSGSLKLKLVGTNRFQSDYAYGVYTSVPLTIVGDGTLIAEGIESGILIHQTDNRTPASLTIESGNITAIGTGSYYSNGICENSEGTLTIRGGHVTAKGSTGSGIRGKYIYIEGTSTIIDAEGPVGINSTNTLVIKDDAKVVAKGTGEDACGVSALYGMTFASKNVEIYSTNIAFESFLGSLTRDSVDAVHRDSDSDAWEICTDTAICSAKQFKTGKLMSVVYSAGEGSGSMDNETGLKGAALTFALPECEFTPPAGYEFKAWSVNGAEKQPGEQVTVTDDTTITALYQKIICSVTAEPSTGAGGSVEGGGSYTYGDTVTLTAAPEENYIFKGWQVNGEIVSTENTYTFTATGSEQIIAVFELVEYTVSAVVAQNGGSVEGGGSYAHGDTVTLTAVPDAGYAFKGWLVNGEIVSTDTVYTFAATEGVEVTAVFEKIPELPETGDESKALLWFALAVVSILGMMTLTRKGENT